MRKKINGIEVSFIVLLLVACYEKGKHSYFDVLKYYF